MPTVRQLERTEAPAHIVGYRTRIGLLVPRRHATTRIAGKSGVERSSAREIVDERYARSVLDGGEPGQKRDDPQQ